jgi:hypothetical protein
VNRMKIATTVMTSLLAILGISDARGAEQQTVKAMSAWVGQGQMVPTGSSWVYFVGSFRGVIFVENAEGDLHAGRIVCPGTIEVNITSGAQRGEGRCVISRSSTDQAFARWTCSGTHGVECRGVFELTSGTGRFSGIQGRSDFRVRSGIGEVDVGRGSEVREVATGLAEWSSLTYTIP